eukprot:854826-Amphidinium_carterae.2
MSRGSTAGPAPKSHGLDFPYLHIQGSSGRAVRKHLEDHEGKHTVHLCRHLPCRTGGDYAAHSTCYSCVEEDSIHELENENMLPVWWRSTGIWRSAGEQCWTIVKRVPFVARMFWYTCRCCCRRRGEQTIIADSESETDHEEDICIAHLVLLGGVEGGRSLADKPCKNRVIDDATPLLEEDLETSQLREDQHMRGQVKLCRHHWLLYRSMRHTQKCSRVSCWRLGAEVLNGMRLCSEHASVACGLAVPPLGRGCRPEESILAVDGSTNPRATLTAPSAFTPVSTGSMNQRPAVASEASRPAGSGVDPQQVAEAKSHLRRLTQAPIAGSWLPGGDFTLALVRGLESSDYYAFNAAIISDRGADTVKADVPALGWTVEVPTDLGVVHSPAYLSALVEMDAPAFLMAARAQLTREGVNLQGTQLEEAQMLQLRLKVPSPQRQHPLVQICTQPAVPQAERQKGSGGTAQPSHTSIEGNTEMEACHIEKAQAVIDATDQGVTLDECIEQFSVASGQNRQAQATELAGWLRGYWRTGQGRNRTEGLRALELEAELRRKAQRDETKSAAEGARNVQFSESATRPARSSCTERGEVAYRGIPSIALKQVPAHVHAQEHSFGRATFPHPAQPNLNPFTNMQSQTQGQAQSVPPSSKRPSLDHFLGHTPSEQRAGADFDDDSTQRPFPVPRPFSAQPGLEDAGSVLKDIAAALSSQDRRAEEAALQQGTGFSEEEKLLMYLARGCDRFGVALAPTEVGKEFVKSMKRLYLAGTGEFKRVAWPTPPSNRILLGLARLEWGGKDHRHLTSGALSVADFPTARVEELEQYVPPEDMKPEHRPRDPPTYLSWARQARNGIKVFACIYGREHEDERLAALDNLCRKHETDEHKYPLDFLRGAWEELNWRWVEELKEELRKCRKILGKEKMRRDELEFVALSPTSLGQAFVTYPQVFDLDATNGYFQKIVEQRLHEKAQRALWDAAHGRTPTKKGFGGWKGEQTPASENKAGAPKGTEKGSAAPKKAPASPPGAEIRNLYPAGRALLPEEVAKSRELAPTDTKGKVKCWDVCSHKGCSRSAAECFRSHAEPIKHTDSLHWTVQAQLFRRGGLKHQTRIEPQDVDAKIQVLREAHRQEEGAKKAEGIERGRAQDQRKRAGGEQALGASIPEERAGETVGLEPPVWNPPEEYQNAEWTHAEDDLRQWCVGPAEGWVQEASTVPTLEARPSASTLQQSTFLEYQALSKSEVEGALSALPLRLQVICRARLVQEQRGYTQAELNKLLAEVAQGKDPELGRSAREALDRCGEHGPSRRVIIQEHDRSTSVSPGHGTIHFQQCKWLKLDYGDQLPTSEDLVAVAGGEIGMLEEKQCLVLNAAAAYLLSSTEKEPTKEEVIRKAQAWRLELWLQAEQFQQACGPAACITTPTEHDMHVFAHDVLSWHHDKDFRTYAVFNVFDLHQTRLHILRVDDWLQPRLDVLQGTACLEGSCQDVWVLIHQRHMSALRLVSGKWSSDPGVPENLIVTEGWESTLQSALETEECSVLNQIEARCPHCRQQRAKPEARSKAGKEQSEETVDCSTPASPKCVGHWGKAGQHPLAWTLQFEEQSEPLDDYSSSSLMPVASKSEGTTNQPNIAPECMEEFQTVCRKLELLLASSSLPLAPHREATKTSTQLRQLHLGAYVTHGRGVTKATLEWRSITRLVHHLAQLEPSIGDYTTVVIVQAHAVGLHRDLHNAGQSWTLSLGDFTGGRLWCEQPGGRHPPPQLHKGETPLRGEWYRTQRQWTRLSAQRWHAVEPWQGHRWSVIIYTPVAMAKLPPVDWATLYQAGFPVQRLQAELLSPDAQSQFNSIVNKACRNRHSGSSSSSLSSELAGASSFPRPRPLHRCCSCARQAHLGIICEWCPHWVCASCIHIVILPNGGDAVCRCCAPSSADGGGEMLYVRAAEKTVQAESRLVRVACARTCRRMNVVTSHLAIVMSTQTP